MGPPRPTRGSLGAQVRHGRVRSARRHDQGAHTRCAAHARQQVGRRARIRLPVFPRALWRRRLEPRIHRRRLRQHAARRAGIRPRAAAAVLPASSRGLTTSPTLSEHPSINVQMFVSSFLEGHAAGHASASWRCAATSSRCCRRSTRHAPPRIACSSSCCAKSLRDGEVANMVAEVFTRVSLTVVHKDRSQLSRR